MALSLLPRAGRPRWSVWQGLVIMLLAVFGPLATLMAGPPPPSRLGDVPKAVAAVFPPWWGASRTALAAATGGSVLGFGRTDFIVLVLPADGRSLDLLRRAGAWLVLQAGDVRSCGASV